MDRESYLERLFGGAANASAATARVEHAANDAGLVVNFEAMKRIPNTLDAHRLIHWAGLEGRQGAMVSALFRANFREGRDIGDAATLTLLAGEAGLDTKMIARLLGSDADLESIIARDAHARSRGINAVPTFLLANQYVLTGAQPVDLWTKVISEMAMPGATE